MKLFGRKYNQMVAREVRKAGYELIPEQVGHERRLIFAEIRGELAAALKDKPRPSEPAELTDEEVAGGAGGVENQVRQDDRRPVQAGGYPVKIAFDIGGVLSKHDMLRRLAIVLQRSPGCEVFVISDMHPVEKIIDMLARNGLIFQHHMVHSADYKTHGEICKAVLCEQLGIDILVDDFIGYVSTGKHVRLLVMPDPEEPYYHDDWKTDGSEGDFGRRNPPGSKRPPEGRRPKFITMESNMSVEGKGMDILDSMGQHPAAKSKFTDEQIRAMWPQAAAELRGFAQHLARNAGITAAQLRMALQMADAHPLVAVVPCDHQWVDIISIPGSGRKCVRCCLTEPH